jgi:hypothetical protein
LEVGGLLLSAEGVEAATGAAEAGGAHGEEEEPSSHTHSHPHPHLQKFIYGIETKEK